MRQAVAPALVLALATFPARAVLAQASILPGYWQTTDRVLSPIETAKTERRCITPLDVAKFMRGPSNHIYRCAYPEDSVGGGRIAFRGECVDKKGHQVQLSGVGTFTATTLTMTAHVTFKVLGIPISGVASTDAHRLGDVCPPGSPGSAPKAP